MIDIHDSYTIEQHQLEKIRTFICAAVPDTQLKTDKLIDSLRVDRTLSEVAQNLTFRLEAHVYGNNRNYEIKGVPTSWWQHFKQDVFPAWLLKKFPVKRTVHKIDVVSLYPELSKRLQDESPRVTITDYIAGEWS